MTAPQNTAAEGRRSRPAGTFAPLRHRLFAVLWAATVLGNTGTFMRDVASCLARHRPLRLAGRGRA